MQKTLIYIDINTKGQIDASGKAVKSSSLYPSFERGQWQVLCINFVQVSEDDLGVVTLTPYNLSGKSYLFVADNNFTDDDSLMLKSYQSTTPFNETDPTSNRINIAGDWIDGGTADLEKGQMSIRINSDTTKFVEVLGNRVSLNSGLYINIKQYIAGLSNPSSIAWIPFVAKNTVRDWGDAQETPPSGEQVVSIINSYFNTPIVYEFSADGIAWHELQTDGDLYYRQRFAIDGTTWSSAVKMIKGENGTDAPTVQIQYSVDGETWTSTAVDSNYIRFSTDGGVSWTLSRKYVGESAPEVIVQYSVNGIDWSSSTENLEYLRVSTDGGVTWQNGFKVKGGKGDTGAVFIPTVDTDGNISWTNNGELENPATINIRGPQGKRGEAFKIDATGTLAERSQYDAEAKDFSFLATDTGNVYIKASDTSGDWSDPLPFKGDKGDKPFNLKGQWSAEVSYSVDDAVTNNGSFYIAKSASTGIEPDGTSAYWELYVAKGATGSPGKDGVDGKDGQPLEANYIDISTVTDGFLVISNDTIPVSVEINNAVYPILGMIKDGLNYKIPTANILAAANLESYSGVWRVWRAGGRPGEKGADGTPGGTFSIEVVGVLPTDPDSTTLYLIPLE